MRSVRSTSSNPRGFTLLELLIVMTIIAILVVAAFSVYAGILKTRKKALALLQVSQIVEAATQYYQDFHVYPPDTDVYEAGDQPPQGMSASQCKFSIMRYLGTEIMDKSSGLRFGPYIRDANEKNNLRGDPTEVDGIQVQLYCDPWGNPYEMDCTHSVRDPEKRTVTVFKPYDQTVDPDKQTLEVKVWSKGPDGQAGKKAQFFPSGKEEIDEDNVMSWTKGAKQ